MNKACYEALNVWTYSLPSTWSGVKAACITGSSIFHLWLRKWGGGGLSELETDPSRAPVGLLGFRVKSSSNSLYGFCDIDDTVQGALTTQAVFMISEFM